MKKIVLKGKEFIVRSFSENDLNYSEKFLSYVNDLIDDPEAIVSFKQKKTIEEEKKWLESVLHQVRLSKMIMLVAENENRIVGGSAVSLLSECRDHVAEIGISILKDFRNHGLGSFLLKEIIHGAKDQLKPRPSIIRLSTFSVNRNAVSFYESNGFRAVACIPKQFQFRGEFVDEVVMLYFV